MKLSVVQAAIGPMTLEENIEEIFTRLDDALDDRPDVIVLPEMWNTGFSPEDLAAERDYRAEELIDAMASFAKTHRIALIGGSLSLWEGERRLNRAFVFDKNGDILAHYDKAHLFPVGGEDECFAPGELPCRFNLESVESGLITCFDLRFPEWARLAVMGRAKILFVPMAWHYSRLEHMHLLARARAVENQCYVVCANCTKKDGYPAMGGGGSCIFSPTGEEILLLDQAPAHASVTLDLSAPDKAKEFFDLWAARRPDLYGELLREGDIPWN